MLNQNQISHLWLNNVYPKPLDDAYYHTQAELYKQQITQTEWSNKNPHHLQGIIILFRMMQVV